MRRWRLAGATVLLLGAAPAAFAQSPAPLPLVVVDVRAAMAKLGPNAAAAADFNVDPTAVPHTGLAGTLGVHVYPLRRRGLAVGVGVEAVSAEAGPDRAARVLGPGAPPDNGLTGSIALDRRLTGVSAVLSVNFGSRDGWSYLSGGVGPLRFATTSSAVAHATAPAVKTTNVGVGARWFTNRHVAFTFDVRAYLTRPAPAMPGVVGRNRQRVLVLSAGISLR